MSIPSSLNWRSLPNSGGRTYVLLSDITTQLSKQYFNNNSVTQFSNWMIGYVFAGGWDPVKDKSNHVYDVSWRTLVSSAVQYVTPTLSGGQQPTDTSTVQIAQLLYQQFGDTNTFVALHVQN